MTYTYFIISPGAQLNSFVQYTGGERGSYIKFGDSQSPHDENAAGVRAAYLTHNPDIGVAAVMDSSVFAAPYLGTRLSNYISTRIAPVSTTAEWYSIQAAAAWGLFYDMQFYDRRVIVLGDLAALQGHISTRLF